MRAIESETLSASDARGLPPDRDRGIRAPSLFSCLPLDLWFDHRFRRSSSHDWRRRSKGQKRVSGSRSMSLLSSSFQRTMIENDGLEGDDVWMRKTVQDRHFPDGTTRKLRRWMTMDDG